MRLSTRFWEPSSRGLLSSNTTEHQQPHQRQLTFFSLRSCCKLSCALLRLWHQIVIWSDGNLDTVTPAGFRRDLDSAACPAVSRINHNKQFPGAIHTMKSSCYDGDLGWWSKHMSKNWSLFGHAWYLLPAVCQSAIAKQAVSLFPLNTTTTLEKQDLPYDWAHVSRFDM